MRFIPSPCRSASRLERHFRGGRFCLLLDQGLIGKPLSDNLTKGSFKPFVIADNLAIRILAIVEPERLFIHIPEKVERLDRNIGAVDPALEQAPEVLNSVC